MGRQSRAHSGRTHRHADLTASAKPRDEAFLFDLLRRLTAPPLLLLLDNVQDPHNLGACLRTAEGAGANAVIVPKDRSVRLNRTVRLVACGAAENVPLVMVTNLARVIDQIKEAGLWAVGTSDQATQTLYELDLSGPLALVMGSEGKGLRRLTAEKCDFLVSIPMHGSVASLNVSVAAGVCLYEAVRQRLIKSG
jgi:23S rRNA (guanosine2251-2'-O)-methyltransferase